jgi:hypothetical protein
MTVEPRRPDCASKRFVPEGATLTRINHFDSSSVGMTLNARGASPEA